MEARKELIEEFFNTLSVVMFRIKYNKKWYELRVAEGLYDKPFVDREGILFGVKSAKINFYVFESGSNKIAIWASEYLNELYTENNFARLPEDEVEIRWEISYAEAFIDTLLAHRDFLIFNQSGEKIKREKYDPYAVY